ncbi:hypothetical protein CWI39_0368p0010, partial [Hamiltosporidium magnivora]
MKIENDCFHEACSSMKNIVIYNSDHSNLILSIENYKNIDSVISAYKRYSNKILLQSKIKSNLLPKIIEILNNQRSNQNIQTSNHIYENIIFELNKIVQKYKTEIFYSFVDTFTNQVFDKIFIELENSKIDIKKRFLKRKAGEINYLIEYPASAFKTDKDREIYIDGYIKNLTNVKSKKYLFITSYLAFILREILFIIISLCKNYGEVEMFLRSKNSKHLVLKNVEEIQITENWLNKLNDFEKVKTSILYKRLDLKFCENLENSQINKFLGFLYEFKELQMYTNEILEMNLGSFFVIKNETLTEKILQMFEIFIEKNLISEIEGFRNKISNIYIIIEDHKIFENFIDCIIKFTINIAKDYSIQKMIKIVENIEFYKNEMNKEYTELKTRILSQITIFRDYLIIIKASYNIIIILESANQLYFLEKLKAFQKNSICPERSSDECPQTNDGNNTAMKFIELCFNLCHKIIEEYFHNELKCKSGYKSGILSGRVESEHVVHRDEISEFWSTMLNKNDKVVTYDEYLIPFFIDIINWLPNWKAAGIDGIYNFYIKKLTSLHKYRYDIVTVICLEGTPQADWYYCGLTYLIPKGTPKTGSDYRPITCMSNLNKLTTKCVTQVVQVEVESQDDFQIIRAKEQALLNVAINKEYGNNLKATWIDVKKAYD